MTAATCVSAAWMLSLFGATPIDPGMGRFNFLWATTPQAAPSSFAVALSNDQLLAALERAREANASCEARRHESIHGLIVMLGIAYNDRIALLSQRAALLRELLRRDASTAGALGDTVPSATLCLLPLLCPLLLLFKFRHLGRMPIQERHITWLTFKRRQRAGWRAWCRMQAFRLLERAGARNAQRRACARAVTTWRVVYRCEAYNEVYEASAPAMLPSALLARSPLAIKMLEVLGSDHAGTASGTNDLPEDDIATRNAGITHALAARGVPRATQTLDSIVEASGVEELRAVYGELLREQEERAERAERALEQSSDEINQLTMRLHRSILQRLATEHKEGKLDEPASRARAASSIISGWAVRAPVTLLTARAASFPRPSKMGLFARRGSAPAGASGEAGSPAPPAILQAELAPVVGEPVVEPLAPKMQMQVNSASPRAGSPLSGNRFNSLSKKDRAQGSRLAVRRASPLTVSVQNRSVAFDNDQTNGSPVRKIRERMQQLRV